MCQLDRLHRVLESMPLVHASEANDLLESTLPSIANMRQNNILTATTADERFSRETGDDVAN